MATPAWAREAGTWFAAAIGIAIEAALVWGVDRLPTWGKIVVFTIPGVLAIIGTYHILRTRAKAREAGRLFRSQRE
jgi:membrane protein implicated in regulation of membrane protease activity